MLILKFFVIACSSKRPRFDATFLLGQSVDASSNEVCAMTGNMILYKLLILLANNSMHGLIIIWL